MLQRRPVRQAGPEATRTCMLGSFRLHAASSPKTHTAAPDVICSHSSLSSSLLSQSRSQAPDTG